MALSRFWLDYVRRGVFPGGCFFAAASFEFDGRPGPVRDAIAQQMDDWFGALERAIQMAKDEGHLKADVDPPQLAFELNALFFGANFANNLRHDAKAFARAQRAIEERLLGARGTGEAETDKCARSERRRPGGWRGGVSPPLKGRRDGARPAGEDAGVPRRDARPDEGRVTTTAL